MQLYFIDQKLKNFSISFFKNEKTVLPKTIHLDLRDISYDINIYKLLDFLDELNIKWEVNKENTQGHQFSIVTEGKVLFVFDLTYRKLAKLTLFNSI